MTSGAKILVTGATGAVGGALVDELLRAGHPFRVMCRSEDQIAAFEARGVEAVFGDFASPPTVRAASDGCAQLFLLPPAVEGMAARARAAVDAAREGGVARVVKVSASDSSPDSPIPWAREHARADRELADRDVAWTILKPAAFMSNLLQAAPAVRRGVLPGMSGHGATPWVAPADVAAAARAVLVDPARQGGHGPDGRTYLLTGTAPRSFPEIAALLGAQLGRRVRYVPVPGRAGYVGLRLAGVDPWMARGIVAQFATVVRHGLDGVRATSDDLVDLLGHAPQDLPEYVAAHRAAFGAAAS